MWKTCLSQAQTESLEEIIFKTLGNQKRRDILRFVGEHKEETFTEIKHAAEIDDSSLVSYHIKALEVLIFQAKDKYRLSDLGQEAYYLIVKTNSSAGNKIVVKTLKKELTFLIVANALLWVAAFFAVSYFQENINHALSSTLILLWLVSNAIIYGISQTTKQDNFRKKFN